MQEFKLTIDLGNDEMQSATDVAEKLTEVAWQLVDNGGFPSKAQSIKDVNGNRVGQYKVWTVPRSLRIREVRLEP